jgi:hypothetical protein
MIKAVETSLSSLKKWCEDENFKGWDPYDGLNSRLFRSVPFLKDVPVARLAWIQLFKRSPVNLRTIAGVPKALNPKGLGLFLSGYCNLYEVTQKPEYLDQIRHLTGQLLTMRTPGWSGSCWGYNFDWQARAFFQPSGTPTIVASTFIANSLLDACEILKEESIFDAANSTAIFISNDLHKSYDGDGNFAYSYSPLDRTSVYNASLLGARFLARLFYLTGETWMKEEAATAVRFCIRHQNNDGSWFYSPLSHHRWIDNFHTGFNLECIAEYMKFTGDNTYQPNLDKGFDYWTNNFFTSEGIPRYYHNQTFPIDLHATAELVIACSRSGNFNKHQKLIDQVLTWTIKNMQSEKGFFYYQKTLHQTNRIPYMRWTQAWMFAALAEYLVQSKT